MLDCVSLKQTSICVVDQSGVIVREGVVESDPEAIASFVRSRAPGTVRIGIETGPTTTWLWTELKRLGLPVICIDARHAKAVLKMQINKSDRNDAAGIARIMQTGSKCQKATTAATMLGAGNSARPCRRAGLLPRGPSQVLGVSTRWTMLSSTSDVKIST
jgi:Transposase